MSLRYREAKEEKDKRRRRELRRAQTDLYYLACKLGYEWRPEAQQGVTEELHKPLCERMDRLRDHPRVATFAPRKSLKSTVFTICLAIQEILRDPDVTIMVVHAVEDEAQSIVAEAGGHFQTSDWLRSLDPVGTYPEGHEHAGEEYRIMPAKNFKKFITAKGFTIRRAGHKPTTMRQPTMVGKGAGSTIEGAHVDMIFPDDIIDRNTLAEATGMQRIVIWFKQSALNVLNALGRIRLVGTRWDEFDFYGTQVIGKPDWDVIVRSALETEGKMDYKGEPIHFGPGTKRVPGGIEAAREREKTALREMGQADYAAQRMNDPSPQSEKPWDQSACEHFTGIKRSHTTPGITRPGTVFVLSDPAPMTLGGLKGIGEKQRGDGTKDFWAIAVVKIQTVDDMQMAVLLDGSASQQWTRSMGCDEICRLMKKWHTNKAYNEAYGGLSSDYHEEMVAASIRNSVSLMRAKDGGPLKYNDSYASGAKNNRFAALADWARSGRFWICSETVPEEFLYGNKETTGFLTNMRKFRPIIGTNRNNLKWDDWGDAVARCTDAALQEFAPSVGWKNETTDYFQEDDENYWRRLSRYCDY